MPGARGEAAWACGGLWRMPSTESPAVRDVRQRLEAGTFDRQHRQAALALTRHREMLLRDGRVGEAREIDTELHGLVEAHAKRFTPRRYAGGFVVVTHTRDGRRLAEWRDVPEPTPSAPDRTVRALVPIVKTMHEKEM